MRLSFHPAVSQLTLLSLTLLPWTVTSYPRYPAALPPIADELELEPALLKLQAAVGGRERDPREDGDVHPEAWAVWPRDPWPALQETRKEEEEEEEEEEGRWEEEEELLQRSQRGDLMARPLSPFPGGYSLESMHYQEGGEDGGKRNEALTSIAGGLNAVSREKGGFGFRFGKKRWTDRGWVEEGRGSSGRKEEFDGR